VIEQDLSYRWPDSKHVSAGFHKRSINKFLNEQVNIIWRIEKLNCVLYLLSFLISSRCRQITLI